MQRNPSNTGLILLALAAAGGAVYYTMRKKKDYSTTTNGCAPIEGVPNYRAGNDTTQCSNCRHYSPNNSYCNLYQVGVGPSCLCDSWEQA